ncbi:hypothetical protein HAZT_HAZT010867, partial [Hyalella azteca]
MFWEAGGGGGTGVGVSATPNGVSGGNRRRKKRPTYGVRTVEITKGKNGFGFTISGQAPCMLSYIVPGSSAERSGLRLGDYLIAVNGQNVSKSTHDDVVRIIGMSKLLKLQIAENYYSDSSDDEYVAVNRQKPKFPNRLRHKQQQTRAERVVRDLQSGAIFSERAAIQLGEAALLSDRDWPESFPSKLPNVYPPPSASIHNAAGQLPDSQSSLLQPPLQCSSPTRRRFMPLAFGDNRQNSNITPTRHFEDQQIDQVASALDDVRIITEQEINKILYPTLAELQLKGPPPDLGESLYRAVVGYLGTIEVPKDSQGGSRLTAIKNCIRRLRIEKKVHTLVLMSVFNERVVLTNPHGITLAQYPAERITFCGVYADDKKFFGLVTVHGSSSDEFSDVSNDGKGNGRNEQGVSSSCHVFMVDPSMVEHNDHARRAKTFRIECTTAEDNAPAPTTDGRSSITDELHASALAMARAENRSAQGVDGRTSVSDEKMRGCRTPAIEGSSPSDVERGAFRAVPPRAPPRPPSDFGVARLTGTRPCGIASIDQIINGVARMGAARSTLCAPQCGTDVKTTHTPSTCASPALHDSDMGPPLTTTILKSVNTDSFKRSNAKAMGLESDKYSESILDPNGSSYERTSNALVPYESQHASAIPVVTSSFSDGTNNQEMSTVIPNSSNYSDENSREFYDDPNEVPAQEEYVLESDLDEQ